MVEQAAEAYRHVQERMLTNHNIVARLVSKGYRRHRHVCSVVMHVHQRCRIRRMLNVISYLADYSQADWMKGLVAI